VSLLPQLLQTGFLTFTDITETSFLMKSFKQLIEKEEECAELSISAFPSAAKL